MVSKLAMGFLSLLTPVLSVEPASSSDALVQPEICSSSPTGQELKKLCSSEDIGDGHHKIILTLRAQTSEIEVGGYKLITEHYNGGYIPPVVEAQPGDTIAAHLENSLSPSMESQMAHGHGDSSPTNLHYFHGGIVSPNNSRPSPQEPGQVELGTGDNVFVHLNSGSDSEGNINSFDLTVPIPGDGGIDARVLEGEGYIAHPSGLNWYHSHMHGISSDQVLGGMSGLLSIGGATDNLKAVCKKDPANDSKCVNDVDAETAELRKNTDVEYAVLRDLPIDNISQQPEEATGATADWTLTSAGEDFTKSDKCGVWDKATAAMNFDNISIRNGFCQRDEHSAWLFTINGQRFPTISVEEGKNLLLRMGNLSPNVAYWLELRSEKTGEVLPLTLLSVDGVVPSRPKAAGDAPSDLEASNVASLVLMPASRTEIYVRNDQKQRTQEETYVLSTRGLNAGTDFWPAIRLAKIVLKPNVRTSQIALGLNVPVEQSESSILGAALGAEQAELPRGCARDLDPAYKEYRRVSFFNSAQEGTGSDWTVLTEIIRPEGSDLKPEKSHNPFDPDKLSIGPFSFSEYDQKYGFVDWTKLHVCIMIDRGDHSGSHKQLWVLRNTTSALHNFHIHQMKFRLATAEELTEHHISPPSKSSTCDGATGVCDQPDYKFYENKPVGGDETHGQILWHDTIPLPKLSTVYIVMSFDAQQQIGRYVFHCHILKHEDRGLMAPIEVWQPTIAATQEQ